MRILVILTDAYGGRGGIALYNRNLLLALSSHPSQPEVIAIPRVASAPIEAVPVRVQYRREATNSKLRFVKALGRELLTSSFDIVICSHINLLPFAKVAAVGAGARLVLFTYGKEAWTPGRAVSNRLVRHVDALVSIRRHTLERLRSWSGAEQVTGHILENAFDLDAYGLAPKRADLLERYGLRGKKVILTLARLDEERHGVDEVLEALPRIRAAVPNAAYLVAGSGKHGERLKQKARSLGLDQFVVFSGEVPEAEKADYYRLGDVFAMPGSHPTLFDTYPMRFSFLEAMACGLPVVASRPEDLHHYAVQLPNVYVDPNNSDEIARAIVEGLSRSDEKVVPAELSSFAFAGFQRRLWTILRDVSTTAKAS